MAGMGATPAGIAGWTGWKSAVRAGIRVALLCSLLAVVGWQIGGLRPARVRAAAISGLHVAGNQIVNGQGQLVVLHGVNRSGTEYACIQNNGIFDGPSDQGSVAAMASWHINAVRVPLNEDCWLGINGAPAAYSGANYQNAIVNYVNLLNQNGLIAILDLHWNAPGTQQSTGQQPMADADHAPAFWTSVAGTFKNNSSVVFDLYNEPHDIPWSCWLNGGSASACNTSYAVAGMNALISAVRGTGATNVVLAGGLAYANDLSQWLANKPTDSTGNLAADWHVYNFNACNSTSCYDSTAAPVAAQVPLMADEIGENDCAHGFIDTLMSWLDAHNSGYLGWAWDTYSCSSFPALISSYDGTPTNYGIGLRDHLAALSGGATATPTATGSAATATATRAATATRTPTGVAPTATVTRAPATATTTPTRVPPTATATATPGGGGTVDVSGSVASNSGPYWTQENVNLQNSATLTGLTITITVQKTAGVTFSGQYTTFWGGTIDQSYTDTGSQIVYTFKLKPGQTIVPGSWLAAAQFGGNGTPHATGGDTYAVSATSGGTTTTFGGHF